MTHVRGAEKRRAQRSVPMLDPLDVDVQQRTLKTLQVHWFTARSYSFVCAALLKQAGFQVTELHTDGEGVAKQLC